MITGIRAEYEPDAGSTKDTPYLAVTGELWGVFREYFENIVRVITAPYCTFVMVTNSLWSTHTYDDTHPGQH